MAGVRTPASVMANAPNVADSARLVAGPANAIRKAALRGHPAEQPQRHALNGYPGATSDDGVRELMSQQRRQQHDRATCAEKPIDHGRVASDGTRQHGRQTPGEQPQDHQHAPVDVHHKPGDPPKRDRITHWVPPMLADKAFRAGG